MKNIFALGVAVVLSATAAQAQVNTINSVVFGKRVPRFLADPTGGMPVRNTAADFLSMVRLLPALKVITFSPAPMPLLLAQGRPRRSGTVPVVSKIWPYSMTPRSGLLLTAAMVVMPLPAVLTTRGCGALPRANFNINLTITAM